MVMEKTYRSINRSVVNKNLFMGLLGNILLVILFLSVCAANEKPFIVMDSLGREVEIQGIPKRIVSTAPSNTEILYDLGLKERVVAVTRHCSLTCDVKGKEEIRGWADMDIKKIISLRPDLVLAFGGLQVPFIDKLEEQGITVFTASFAASMARRPSPVARSICATPRLRRIVASRSPPGRALRS